MGRETIQNRQFFSFPREVNEVSARFTAGIVAIVGIVTLLSSQYWLLLFMAYGFLARVGWGPKFSPLAQFAVRVVAKNLPEHAKMSPGPPKRFAQAIGASVTTIAAVSALGFGNTSVAIVLVSMLVVFASMESLAGVCVGCKMFAILMKLHVIPESVCQECADLTKRYPSLAR
ncbi:MAG: DUF4395 domain-containing protein [Acidimicrobiales bacterium]|nr:DUF4395 domain-containing protein [Acidimicrobiales bacterium]